MKLNDIILSVKLINAEEAKKQLDDIEKQLDRIIAKQKQIGSFHNK